MSRKPFCVVVCLLVSFALCDRTWAQQPTESQSAVNPLVRVLQEKGILTAEEVEQISQASTAGNADRRLAKLLLTKGVITQTDYDHAFGMATVISASPSATSTAAMIPAVYRVPANSATGLGPATPVPDSSGNPSDQGASTAPVVIPAIIPTRVFPVGGLQREALKPVFSIGSLRVTPYGFLKATFVRDSSSPGGDDFPLPGFLTDTGPEGSPEFHVKARSSRFGANFEWLDPSPNLTITGKIEADFEGDFTRVSNRNLSSIRSSMPSIRLAYMRLDYKLGEKDTISALFGQDWTPFASSTLPSLVETMLSGGGYGTLWNATRRCALDGRMTLGDSR